MIFSIIIPSYGQVEYVAQAIESAIAQTFKNVEVIVVDDGSIDGSLEIAQQYPGIKLIQQKNKGLASARNTGIMNSKGEYVLMLDADDVLLPDCVQKIAEKAEETDADVICPSIRCFGKAEQDVILMPDPAFDDFKEGNRLAYCCAIKREALLEVGGYSPKMDVLGGWEDLWMHYALMEKGKKIVTIQEPLVKYRTKEESMWTKAEQNKGALWAQIVKDFPQTKDHVKS